VWRFPAFIAIELYVRSFATFLHLLSNPVWCHLAVALSRLTALPIFGVVVSQLLPSNIVLCILRVVAAPFSPCLII
jgi:hypothetical protein